MGGCTSKKSPGEPAMQGQEPLGVRPVGGNDSHAESCLSQSAAGPATQNKEPMSVQPIGGSGSHEEVCVSQSPEAPAMQRQTPMGVARQVEGHPEVVLRDTPLQGRVVAMIPNGDHVEILQKEAEVWKLRWKTLEGWAKACNVEEQGSTSGHLFWEVDLDGRWVPMEPSWVQMQLSAAFRQGQNSLNFVCQRGDLDFEYEVRFESAEQTNLSTGVKRRVRWSSAMAGEGTDKVKATYSTWDEVAKILRRADVVLIKASWLMEQAQCGNVLPRRQDLPPGTTLEVENLHFFAPTAEMFESEGQFFSILSVSYAWLAKHHPDPDGLQLRTYGSLLRKYLSYNREKCILGLERLHFGGLAEVNDGEGLETSVAVFLDWCSLYQKPRSQAQFESFERALDSMHIWYAHELFSVCMLTRQLGHERPYVDRGWPTFESSVASLIKAKSKMTLDLGMEETGPHGEGLTADADADAWRNYRDRANATRKWPRTPQAFAAELSVKHFTNGRTDKSFVQDAYTRVLHDVTSFIENLEVEGIPYHEESFIDFVAILPQCPKLRYLWGGNRSNQIVGNAGAFALASALPRCTSLIDIGGFDFAEDAGMQAVISACPRWCEYRWFDAVGS